MDFTKPIKSQFVWCVDCEKEVILDLNSVDGEPVHTVVQWDGDEYGCDADYYPCFGPFTSCPPPDNFSDNWDLELEEPSAEELAEMNLQAEILLQELEG